MREGREVIEISDKKIKLRASDPVRGLVAHKRGRGVK
jgi:hypothetical protein